MVPKEKARTFCPEMQSDALLIQAHMLSQPKASHAVLSPKEKVVLKHEPSQEMPSQAHLVGWASGRS